MATANTATVVPFQQPKTPAERAAAYRARKKAKNVTKTPVTPAPVTPVTPVTPSRPSREPAKINIAQIVLTATAFGMAAVGIVMNGWYAHTLGSSQIAGWVFSAVGVAADAIALAVPACAAAHWQASQRLRAVAGWLLWFAVFAFTATAGIGFASTNISDVTTSRAERVTPAITAAQAALDDAKDARRRECASGQGKVCQQREANVVERQQALDAARAAVAQAADPQTEGLRRIVAWLTAGRVSPTGDDFAMLRLILLALLPQTGGILLMLARR